MKRIVIISDCNDAAFNEIRASIVSYLDNENINDVQVEPLVSAKEFSIINASFLIRLMAEIYEPKNTLFLVVVNALRTDSKERARIMGETNNGFKFVGANTGALNWLIKDFGLKNLYKFGKANLTGKEFVSFGGKFFHAPMAARLIAGKKFDELGKVVSPDFLVNFNIVEGTVLHIDNFGVIKINSKPLSIFKEGDVVQIFVNNTINREVIFTHSMKDYPDGTLTLFPGSSLNNLLEIAFVRFLNTAQSLNIKIGDVITFKVKNEKN